jgi:hypothetical protein
LSAREQRTRRIPLLYGWLLDRVVELDPQCPGFAAHVLKSSIERRHVLAAWLTTIRDDDDIGDRLRWLTSAGHDAILRDAFGIVPPGYRATLARSAHKIQPPRFYRYLWLVLGEGDPNTVRAVRQTAMLDHERLRLIRSIPADLRVPTTVIAGNEMIRDLAAAIDQLERLGLPRTAMIAALPRAGTPKAIAGFLLRWSRKLTFPPHPAPAGSGYRPVERGDDLHRLALRHRNCLDSYLTKILDGQVAFAEAEVDGACAIVELARHTAGWVLEDVWGPRNRAPSKAAFHRAVAYLAAHDIHRRERRPLADQPWSAYRRLTRRWEVAQDV